MSDIDGGVVRWYRTERLGMSERELAARVFPDRGPRGAHSALNRLETGGSVKLTDDEKRRLSDLVSSVGDELDLIYPMCWVLQTSPVSGVRPIAGHILMAADEAFMADFLETAKNQGLISPRAGFIALPQRYAERDMAKHFAAGAHSGHMGDWIWLAKVEKYLAASDDPRQAATEAIEGLWGPYMSSPKFTPELLYMRHIGRIEFLQSDLALSVNTDKFGEPPVAVTDEDFRRLDRLAVLAHISLELADERAKGLRKN